MAENTILQCSKSSVDAFPADIDYVPDEIQARAKKELFEDENTKIQSLKLLRSMLENEKNLRWQDEDLFLLAFLRARKFDVQRAFNLIKGFYNNFGNYADLYYNLNFDTFKKTMDQNIFCILPYRDSEGSAIILFRYSSWIPEITNAVENMICVFFALMVELRKPSSQIAGFQLIADFKDNSLKLAMQTTPFVLSFFGNMIQNALPIRMRGIHIVNQNRFLSYIWPFVKLFLSKKLYDRIHIHGKDMKNLHKYFHPRILPADWEGELPPFSTAEWRQNMEASEDYIKHVISFGYEKYLNRNAKHAFKKSTANRP